MSLHFPVLFMQVHLHPTQISYVLLLKLHGLRNLLAFNLHHTTTQFETELSIMISKDLEKNPKWWFSLADKRTGHYIYSEKSVSSYGMYWGNKVQDATNTWWNEVYESIQLIWATAFCSFLISWFTVGLIFTRTGDVTCNWSSNT